MQKIRPEKETVFNTLGFSHSAMMWGAEDFLWNCDLLNKFRKMQKTVKVFL